MYTNGTPASPYLAKWSCTIEAAPPHDDAVARTATWAKATMHHWGPRRSRRRRRPHRRRVQLERLDARQPVEVTLLLHGSVLTIEVSDAGAGLAVFAGPRPLGAGGRGLAAAVDIAQQIGIDGGAWGTRVWARLHFQ